MASTSSAPASASTTSSVVASASAPASSARPAHPLSKLFRLYISHFPNRATLHETKTGLPYLHFPDGWLCRVVVNMMFAGYWLLMVVGWCVHDWLLVKETQNPKQEWTELSHLVTSQQPILQKYFKVGIRNSEQRTANSKQQTDRFSIDFCVGIRRGHRPGLYPQNGCVCFPRGSGSNETRRKDRQLKTSIDSFIVYIKSFFILRMD